MTAPHANYKPLLHAAFLAASFAGTASAAPITFNTALPISTGEALFRQQFIVTRASDKLFGVSRSVTTFQSVSVVGYGPARRTAVFGVLPVVHIDQEVGSERAEATGLGDSKLFARYEIFRADGPGRTFRLSPFAGVTVPTGEEDETGDGSLDVFGGLIATFAMTDWVFDGQAQYVANREANGFERGDQASFDVSLQYRLLPNRLETSTSGFLFGVIEANVSYLGEDRLFGVDDPNSGGVVVSVSPGVQYAAKRWIAEAAVRIPVAADLNGNALEPDYSVIASLRLNF